VVKEVAIELKLNKSQTKALKEAPKRDRQSVEQARARQLAMNGQVIPLLNCVNGHSDGTPHDE